MRYASPRTPAHRRRKAHTAPPCPPSSEHAQSSIPAALATGIRKSVGERAATARRSSAATAIRPPRRRTQASGFPRATAGSGGRASRRAPGAPRARDDALRPRQQQRRHIRASQQQHQRNHTEQYPRQRVQPHTPINRDRHCTGGPHLHAELWPASGSAARAMPFSSASTCASVGPAPYGQPRPARRSRVARAAAGRSSPAARRPSSPSQPHLRVVIERLAPKSARRNSNDRERRAINEPSGRSPCAHRKTRRQYTNSAPLPGARPLRDRPAQRAAAHCRPRTEKQK